MKVHIQNLSHSYDVPVLNDLNLQLNGYKSIALIGVSGSGKSTLLRILSGLEKPTTGQVSINDSDVQNETYRKSVGFVFQSHNLFPHLTLLDNITLVLEKTRGQSKAEAKENAYKYLELLHLCDQRFKLPKHVSGGQAQRGSIARAFSINPEVVFLDEPTASLDPILTFEVLSAIRELRDVGKAFVLVSHVMSFVKDFADYVLFMHKGSIVEQGTPEILNNPETKELQDFMAKVP